MRSLVLLLLLAAAPVALAADDAPKLSITMDDLPVNGPDEPLADLKRMNDAILAAFTQAGVPAVGFVNEAKLYARQGEVDGRIALLELEGVVPLSLRLTP